MREENREKESMEVIVREVWEENLELELNLIRHCIPQFPIASLDTEYPGTVFDTSYIPKHAFSSLSPAHLYFLMKQNVDILHLIQLGLTLSDPYGNLPKLGTNSHYIWQFNFRNFDPDRHVHDPDAISLLKAQGIDFSENKRLGIDSDIFGIKFVEYGLGLGSGLTWITFHGLYDYGYLIKMLTHTVLPNSYDEFRLLVHFFFGPSIHDLKPMAKAVRLYGGLDKIAKTLKLNRAVGKAHQAGSDSLLTMQVFFEVLKNYYTPVIIPIPM